MSIIERENPLNLQYKICVVTAASSPLGVVICKTLLKANALVLGIDKNPRDESLNAGLGTHFQFEECDISNDGGGGGDVVKNIIASSKEKFEGLGGRFDVLVDLVREGEEEGDLGGIEALTKGIGDVMRESGGAGSIITVAESNNGDEGLVRVLLACTQRLLIRFLLLRSTSQSLSRSSTREQPSERIWSCQKLPLQTLSNSLERDTRMPKHI